MLRKPSEWQAYAEKNITGGYVAGSDVSRFYDGCLDLLEQIEGVGKLHLSGVILDLGCANGRLAVVLDGREDLINYVGVDVDHKAIAFCRAAFDGDPRFDFYHASIYNKRYSSSYRKQPKDHVLPLTNATADIAVANSFFTHTGDPSVAIHYLSELARVIKPGGVLYSTWFRNPPHELSTEEARTIYRQSFIIEALSKDFEIVRSSAGETLGKRDQWRIVAERKGDDL